MPSDDIPNGLDWGDGKAGRIGTVTPPGTILVQDQSGLASADDKPIEELPDSPEIERAEQATITHRFSLSYNEALTRLGFYGRGTLLTDSAANVSKILSCKVQRQPPNFAILTIVAESVSFDSPPDKFSVQPVELGLNILKHPRYFYALGAVDSSGNIDAATAKLNQYVIRLLQNYFENSNPLFRDYLENQLYWSISTNIPGGATDNGDGTFTFTPAGQSFAVTTVPGSDMAKAAAMEIVTKYWRGEETPYVVGYRIVWTAFYFRPQYLNPGGYIEDPILDASPQLPPYFYSPSFPPDPSVTIFDRLPIFNPQCCSLDGTSSGKSVISWLRKADEQREERTWFEVDRTWEGSAVGFWDPDIYAARRRPASPSDYNTLTPEPVPDSSQVPQVQQ